ncbi:MAG TPA: sigma-70 family RNA polymerase sigma factor [Ktedonobacterales bacterium]|nr:sigma-70 family RNA polymerase sigma factor [Ktedonobacterales bacterium]
MSSSRVDYDLGAALAGERARLVRLCQLLTSSADSAEDLAQETLLEAWRLLDRLREPEGLGAWLTAIARNVCHRWLRAHGREQAHLAPAISAYAYDEGSPLLRNALASEADDPLAQVERAEVAALVSRALATLPETTRALTIASSALTTVELARSFGLSEGAVRVRLHRGRQALRRALSSDLRVEAEALDLALPEASDWRESRIWCPFCGGSYLRYRVNRQTGEFAFRCAGSCLGGMAVVGGAVDHELVEQVSSPKSLITRHCLALATIYRDALAGETFVCDCGSRISLRSRSPDDMFPADRLHGSPYGVIGACPTCGVFDESTAWHLVLDTAEAQRFWRQHPRIRALPITPLERDNRPALLTGFEAIDGGARIEIVSDASTYALLHVTATGAL